ncbi:hypothetical protein, partial [Vibrio splendidus]|uniref:hypothetical protein n=1 Tax=Vibrio splendidus TaxID=29497 RepID=UPI001A7E09B5
ITQQSPYTFTKYVAQQPVRLSLGRFYQTGEITLVALHDYPMLTFALFSYAHLHLKRLQIPIKSTIHTLNTYQLIALEMNKLAT